MVVVVTIVAARVGLDEVLVVLEHARREGGQVDILALGVDDRGLAEHHGKRLASGDLTDHAGDLAVLVEHLDELARLHVVLGRTLYEVLGELVLADLDLFLLGDDIQQNLAAEGLLA